MTLKIAIVGCGAAGISALRVLSEVLPNYPLDAELVGFERSSKTGGIWVYDNNKNNSSTNSFASPMYRDLCTNLPKEVMYYPDMFFSENVNKSFIHHSDVLNYLQEYVHKFDLVKYIQFNTDVECIEPTISENKVIWNISIKNIKTGIQTIKSFDAVFICNGHFDRPKIPQIPGLENFKGLYFHSKYYTAPEEFKDKVVCVLGARSSGLDISLQLAKYCKKVILSHNRPKLIWKEFPDNFEEVTGIDHIIEDGKTVTVNGEIFDADVIIFCTGYDLNFDFLHDKSGLQNNDCWIHPLFEHVVNPYFPTSMFLIGLGYEIPPFTHFYMQSKLARSFLQKCAKLSSSDNMMENDATLTQYLIEQIKICDETSAARNLPIRFRHYFGNNEWSYLDRLQAIADNIMTFRVPKHFNMLFDLTKKWRYNDTNNYRKTKFKLSDTNKLGFELDKSGYFDDAKLKDYQDLLENPNGWIEKGSRLNEFL